MSRHLKTKDVIGYIYQTLTDAQRETMDRHLTECSRCRARLEAEKRIQRRIRYDLQAEAQKLRPSATMSFDTIRPHLQRNRKVANLSHRSTRLLSSAAVLAAIFLVGFFVMQTFSGSRAGRISTLPTRLFELEWDDPTPYQDGLVESEKQAALATLNVAPVYHIQLDVTPNLRRVDGRQAIRYVNRTGDRLDEIYLRLLPNLSGSKIDVTNVRVNGRFATPFQESDIDLRVPLNRSLAPGDAVIVNTDFTLRMQASRQGFHGSLGLIESVLNLANFYPIVANYDARGWDLALPANGVGGIAEDSFFLVQISTPANLTVIASGLEVEREVVKTAGESRQTLTFAAGPVNQFFITASERYTEMTSTTVGSVTINSYAHADYLLDDAQEALNYAVKAMQLFEDKFGPYPFAELNIVGTPTFGATKQREAFPGIAFITMGHHGFGQTSLESNAVYGVAYQWFGRINRNNMVHEPWLGYALTNYSELFYHEEESRARDALREAWLDQRWYGTNDPYTTKVGHPAYAYQPAVFQATMNGRGPVFFDRLANAMGQETFLHFLSTYYQTYRWRMGNSVAFKQLAEEACGCDLTDLFEAQIYP